MTIQGQPPAAPESGTPDTDPPAGQPATPPSGFRDPGTRPPAAPAQPSSGAPADRPAAPPRPRTLASDLPDTTLAARLERERRALLRREFGTDDAALVKARLAAAEEAQKKLAEYEAKEAEAKRAQMSEIERMKADLEAERAAREAAEAKARELDETIVARERDEHVRSVASKYVDPDFLDYARDDLKRHIAALQKTEPRKVQRWTDADTDAFFKDLVKRKPRLAPTQPTPSESAHPPARSAVRPSPASVPARRPGTPQPIRNPSAPPAKLPPGTAANGKTLRPGLPNSMSAAEVKDHLRATGRRPWG